jgi:hypothetical protein
MGSSVCITRCINVHSILLFILARIRKTYHTSWRETAVMARARYIYHCLTCETIPDFLQGVLVHFSEARVNNLTPPSELKSTALLHGYSGCFSATTPWIAMIPCDFNSTASTDEDVFTLARDKGAKAAVSTTFLLLFLYPFHSQTHRNIPVASVLCIFISVCHQSSICRPRDFRSSL